LITANSTIQLQAAHKNLHSFPTRRSSDLGAVEKCGMYFPVTDELGRVVLMLDDSRKVAGVGEYDVYGNVNTVTFSAETAHPYAQDRKSTRLNSSHLVISYAVFCLKKKKYI